MPLKCSNHRSANAVGQCSNCGIAVCEICNRSEDEKLLMCEACAMLSTFTTMRKRKKDIDEKREHKELEDSSKKIKRRSVMITASIVIALIIIILEVIWYIRLTSTVTNSFEPSDNYFATTVIINNTIEVFMEDHDGKVPDSMEDLLGNYLPDNEIWKKIFKDYYYKKISPNKYELTPPLIDDDLPDIVFTDEGPEVVGI